MRPARYHRVRRQRLRASLNGTFGDDLGSRTSRVGRRASTLQGFPERRWGRGQFHVGGGGRQLGAATGARVGFHGDRRRGYADTFWRTILRLVPLVKLSARY